MYEFMKCLYLWKSYVVIYIYKMEKKWLHYPRLDTVLTVDEFIKEHSGGFKKKALWENLPKKMMYQIFCTIFDYLLQSGKIAVDKEGKIRWIYNPELMKNTWMRSLSSDKETRIVIH